MSANHLELEEAIRLAEVGEFLYNECAYDYGDGYEEPLEYGIEWSWVQSKPDEYGQGQLLAASVRWHSDQAEDGITTEATKLRTAIAAKDAELAKLREEIERLREALEPFAKVAEHDIGDDEANVDLFKPMSSPNNRAPLLRVGDFRRALAALAKEPTP